LDDLNILIKAKLSTTKKEIEDQLKLLNDKITRAISVKIKIDPSGLSSVTAAINKVKQVAQQASNQKVDVFNRKTLEADGRQFFMSSSNIVERVKKEFKSLGTVDVNFLKNSQKDIIGFVANVTRANGVIEKLRFNMARIQSGNSMQRGYVFSSANLIDNNAGSNIQSALNKLQVYENKIAKLKASFTSPATGIKDTGNLSALNTQYDRILSTINQVRQSNTNLSNEQRRGIIQNISSLELQISRYRDLQRVMATTNTRTLSASDISLYQGNMANRLASLQVGRSTVFAQPEIQAQVNRLTADVARFGTVGGRSVRELNLQFAQLTTSVRTATNEMSRINGAADSFLTTLTKNFGKMLAWGMVEFTAVCSESDNVTTNYERGNSKEGH